MEEFIAIQQYVEEGNDVLQNVHFRALLAGMTGFMERFEPPESNSAHIVLRSLENDASEVLDASAMSLVIMGMWFSDYNGFRADVVKEIQRSGLAQ